MFVLVQYVDKCDRLGVRCHLSWRPRGANVEADRITKHYFEYFCPKLRPPVMWSELDLSVLIPLLEFGSFRLDLDAIRAVPPGCVRQSQI